MEKEKLYCFDFDGTLTTRDTLIEFIKYTKGKTRFLLGFLLYSPLLVLMKLHLYPNWKAKQKVFKYFFGGMPIETFNAKCKAFANANLFLLRPIGLKLIHKCLEKQQKVYIVSASIDNWVTPFFIHLGLEGAHILGTQIEVKNGKVTGHFLSPNCYGVEKVARICQDLSLTPEQAREKYDILAFGDSEGDREMLSFAHTAHYKPFRESSSTSIDY